MTSIQAVFDLADTHANAVSLLGELEQGERGGVYTRPEVVEFILDLIGYDNSENLTKFRILEPSCGEGDFLEEIVDRLMKSAARFGVPASELSPCVRAIDVGSKPLIEARKKIAEVLAKHNVTEVDRARLDAAWFLHADFLMAPFSFGFTHVVGNPPYVRQEDLPLELLKLYRGHFSTMYDRADLYVVFFERCLGLLDDGGKLGFICSDRWMKNKYGGPLRGLVSSAFHLEMHVDFTNCPAFKTEVVAYPAVTVISRSKGTETAVSFRPEISRESLSKLVPALRKEVASRHVTFAENVASGNEPWLLENLPRLEVIRRIEANLPKVEEVGCKIGIGVATGADSVYIGDSDKIDVEEDARLPLVMTRDFVDGQLEWKGKFVLNPFLEDGRLRDLSEHPKLAAYLELNKDRILARNVAKKNPSKWYRTIDRIYPALKDQPKLLIPDIKGNANVVYDEGKFYPHHNLYFVISEEWDIRALQAVLLSQVTQAFIATYSLKMRGDCLRYQAQYLRRLRLPKWSDVSSKLRLKLTRAAIDLDFKKADLATRELYQLSDSDWAALVSV